MSEPAAATLPMREAASPLPRLGFLGAGWIGRHRMQAIVESGLAEVGAVADPSAECLGEAETIAPGAARLTSLDELLDQDLDGIVIATPSALHAEQAARALECGVAVFCQKPLARSGAETAAVIAAAKAADRLLGVDLSYRHVEGSRRIRELAAAGALGEVYAVDLVFHNAYGPDKPWFYDAALSGGGCVIDLGIHLVDLALWTLDGSRVAEVTSRRFAAGRPIAPGDPAVEDHAVARLDLDSGAAVTLACSWRLHAGRDAVIEAAFHGTAGGARLRNVGGSFYDFVAEHYQGTRTETLCGPPDAWGGRAAVAWARRLAADRRYDPQIERLIEVAGALDRIYGR
jgi:predicted dehydrogenase